MPRKRDVETLPETSAARVLDRYLREHDAADMTRQRNAAENLVTFFGAKHVKTIDVPMCRAYAEARRTGAAGKPSKRNRGSAAVSDATIRRELVVMRAACAHAVLWRRLGKKDLPTFALPRELPAFQEFGWLTEAQVEALLSAAKGPLRDFIELAYMWGARRNSVETLETYQVDLVNGRVNLAKRGQRRTPKRKPIVRIFPAMRATIERLVAGATDGKLFGAKDFYKDFRALCEKLGLPEKHPHVLRHSRATHLLMKGASPYHVARLLGDTLATVERVYGHHSPDFLIEDTL